MIENRERFISRISGFEEEDLFLVMYAYDMAKKGHSDEVREGNGERYFEHPRNVALILMDELEIFDINMLCAALLHDVGEDTVLFGNKYDGNYAYWLKVAAWRCNRSFNPEVTRMMLDVTKPFVDKDGIKSKDEGMKLYLENLRQARPDSIIIKMADRLHNLRTLDDVILEKRIRKIHETESVYYPIFQKGVLYEPVKFEMLYGKIIEQLDRHFDYLKTMAFGSDLPGPTT